MTVSNSERLLRAILKNSSTHLTVGTTASGKSVSIQRDVEDGKEYFELKMGDAVSQWSSLGKLTTTLADIGVLR